MTISPVQSNDGNATAGTTFTVSTISNIATGNLLVVCMSGGELL